MANTKTLTIPFHLPSDNKPASNVSDLSKRVSQIIAQKGPFRDVSEHSNFAQDSDEEDAASQRDDASLEDEVDVTPQKRQEKLWASKNAMIEQWKGGMNELLTALDFLSLLISKQSLAAKAGMSPSMRDARVPPGSFEPKVIKAPSPLKSKTQQEGRVSRGWKARGFESAFSKFSAASERLRKEADRESQFWAEAAALREKGWKISRHPRESKAIGIHFGLAESAPQFRNRGFALLRQADDGIVYLDRPATSESPKKLQIRIKRDGQQTGSSAASAPPLDMDRNASDLACEARDELLEAELFYEISREARLVSNQNVSARAQIISFGIGQDCKVTLSYEDTSSESIVSGADDEMARCIRLSLTSLLLVGHENNLERRSQMPQALSSRPAAIPELAILRPLVANLRQAGIKAMWEATVKAIFGPLKQAGIDLRLDPNPSIDTASEGNNEREPLILPTDAVRSGFSLLLPNGKSLEIRITSSMDQPIYGTRYDISDVDFGFARITAKTYSDGESVLAALRRVITLALVDSVHLSETPSGKWEVTMPQKGELSYLPSGTKKTTTRVRLQLQSASLILKVVPTLKEYDTGKKTLAWSWNVNGTRVIGNTDDVAIAEEEAKELSLLDVISKVVKP